MDFYDGFFKNTNQGDEDSHSSIQGFFSGDNLTNSNPSEPNYRWRTHAFGVTASGLIQERLFVHAVAYENYFEGQRDAKNSPSISPSTTTVRESGVKTEATYYSDNQDLYFFGFEFSFPTLEYKLVNLVGASRRLFSTRADVAMWLRYQANVGDFKIDGGLHMDLGSMFERGVHAELFQPRVNMSWILVNDWKFKVSYGRFNQNIITVNNEDDVVSVFDAWIAVPEFLNSESADHYVLGVEGNVTPSLSTSVQTYYKHYSSLVTYNRDKVDSQDPDFVNGKGQSYGMESLVRYGIPLLDLYAAYTLGWTETDANGLTYPPRYDRRHTLNLLANVHVTSDLDLSLRWEFGSGFPYTQTVGYYDRLQMEDIFSGQYAGDTGTPYSLLGEKNGSRLPTYHRLDMSATYRFVFQGFRGTAGIHVLNVYDRRNLFYFDRTTGKRTNMLAFFPSATLSMEF